MVSNGRQRNPKAMDPLEKVKKLLEAGGEEIVSTATLDSLPPRFYDAFILKGLSIDAIEHGRILCSMTVPPRLLVFSFSFSLIFCLDSSNLVALWVEYG